MQHLACPFLQCKVVSTLLNVFALRRMDELGLILLPPIVVMPQQQTASRHAPLQHVGRASQVASTYFPVRPSAATLSS